MRWDAGLDALDRKFGRVVTVEDWRIVGEKAPDALTDDDLLILKAFGGAATADLARALRTKALAPPTPPPQPSPEPQTKTAAVNTDKASKLVTRGYLEKVLAHEAEGMAEEVVAAIKAGLTPVFERLAGLERESANAQSLGLGAQVSAMGKQIEDLRTEINYLTWVRQQLIPTNNLQEAEKVPR